MQAMSGQFAGWRSEGRVWYVEEMKAGWSFRREAADGEISAGEREEKNMVKRRQYSGREGKRMRIQSIDGHCRSSCEAGDAGRV